MNLRGFVAGALALALAGCATPSVTPGTNPTPAPAPITPSQVASDAALIFQGLHNAIPLLSAPAANPGLPQATVQKVLPWIADLQAAASALAVADSAAAQQPIATRIGTDLSQIGLSITSTGAPIPGGFANYLAAADVLLPAIEIALGMPAPAHVGMRMMDPVEARHVLARKPHSRP